MGFCARVVCGFRLFAFVAVASWLWSVGGEGFGSVEINRSKP